MKPGRIVMLVLGTLAALMGLGLLIAAAGVGWVNFQQRDNGYFTTPTERYDVATRAITSPGLDVLVDEELPDVLPVDSAGRMLLRGTSATGQEIFIGIGPQEDVARYLANVRHSEITELKSYPFRVQYREVPGDAEPAAPGAQPFWSTSAQGSGTQQIEWDLRSGRWAVVVMNADGGAPVSVDLQAGVRSDLLWPVFIGLLIGGIVLLVVGVPLIVAGAAGLGRHGPPPHRPAAGPMVPAAGSVGPGAEAPYGAAPSGAAPYGATPSGAPPYGAAPYGAATAAIPPGGGMPLPTDPQPSDTSRYPVRLNGHLDPGLSRGMWLIKWFLAIPHYIVLFFLWFAFFVTTIVAGFAILFTGRYPRSLFNFNVGVLRWNWRVAFYAYAAIGTDRYPPFTLARTDYPADFDVDYPEQLSRGLVLIKWWLLALPQLLIVAAFSGTASTWGNRRMWVDGRWVDGRWVDGTWVGYDGGGGGISLIGLLVLVAGFSLLFTGRFGRRLFDLLVGLDRWIYRVIAYVALMRDEYPPFRLDMGPADPADVPPAGHVPPEGYLPPPVPASQAGPPPSPPVQPPPAPPPVQPPEPGPAGPPRD